MTTGRGTCKPTATGVGRDSCGGERRGQCTAGRVCECKEGWTGPHCLASAGFDDIIWDQPETLADVGFVLPNVIPAGLLFGLGALILLFVISVQWKKQIEGWSPIPEVEAKYKH